MLISSHILLLLVDNCYTTWHWQCSVLKSYRLVDRKLVQCVNCPHGVVAIVVLVDDSDLSRCFSFTCVFNILVYVTIQHCLQRVCVSIDKDREKKGVNVSLGRFLVRRRRKEEAFGDDSSPCLVLFNRSNSALVYQDCHMPFSFYLFAWDFQNRVPLFWELALVSL